MSGADYRVSDDLREIKKTLTRIDKLYATQMEACKAHFGRTTNLEVTVFGNGTEGLKIATVRLEQVVQQAVKQIEAARRSSLAIWANTIAAVSAVAALIGVLVVLFR